MKIEKIKINGIENPVGFLLDHITLSYVITDVKQINDPIILEIFKGEELIYNKELDYSHNYATDIDLDLEKETRYVVSITCGEENGKGYFETGTNFDCPFISPEKDISHPVVFKRFVAEKQVKSARLYVTGLGLYEAFINGQKVGNEFLTPNCNNYNAYLQYQTYDISDSVKKENIIEIALGDGWYKGRFGLRHRENIFGDKYVTAAKIIICYEDGTKAVISTDDTWSARASFVTSSSIYDGECVDYTRKIKETFAVRYVASIWHVTERISPAIVVKHTIKPVLYVSPRGEQILDFGQNFSGFVSINCKLKYGQRVRLVAGEVLQNECFYRDNLRSAKAEFVYISDGEQRIVRPQFTFFGFRYMLVEGIDQVSAQDFIGNVIYSDLENTTTIDTANEKMNRLLSNCLWGQRSNFVDVPTDCPQRDERLGWTGDAEVFSGTACYQMDCRAFYEKYLTDLRVEQIELNGGIPGYAPSFYEEKESSRSIWADASTIIPWNLYRYYGNKEVLKKHFPLMKDYADFIINQDNENGGSRLYNFGFHLGDWLSQDGISPNALKGGTSEYFIASVYYYNTIKVVADTAAILSDCENEKYYREIQDAIKKAILSEYFTQTGRLAIDTQTAYVICAKFDLYANKEKLTKGFAKRLKKDNYQIKGGFVGATQLVQSMIKCGLVDDAFRVLYNESFPGWFYCVNLGATTIWERWNSLNPDGSISGTEMNSLNHYSYGAVAEAFYAYIAGLCNEEVAFKKFTIRPQFNYRLKKLDFSYESVAGRFIINYQLQKNKKVGFYIEIPYGVQATFEYGKIKKELTVGANVFEIELDCDLGKPFSVDSKVCDLLSYEKSSEVIKQVAPALHRYITHNDIGINGDSFRKLCSIAAFSIPQASFDLINEKLKEVEYT